MVTSARSMSFITSILHPSRRWWWVKPTQISLKRRSRLFVQLCDRSGWLTSCKFRDLIQEPQAKVRCFRLGAISRAAGRKARVEADEAPLGGLTQNARDS